MYHLFWCMQNIIYSSNHPSLLLGTKAILEVFVISLSNDIVLPYMHPTCLLSLLYTTILHSCCNQRISHAADLQTFSTIAQYFFSSNRLISIPWPIKWLWYLCCPMNYLVCRFLVLMILTQSAFLCQVNYCVFCNLLIFPT